MLLKPNLNTVDRIARLLIGVACIYIGFINQAMILNNIISILLGLFGIINVVAAILSHCPVYGLAGFSTYHAKEDSDNAA